MTAFLIITGADPAERLFVAAEFAIVGAPRAAIDARAAQGQPARASSCRRCCAIRSSRTATSRPRSSASPSRASASGMYGEHVLADWHSTTLLGRAGAPAWLVSHGLASVVAVAILTYFHIVVGEMVPEVAGAAARRDAWRSGSRRRCCGSRRWSFRSSSRSTPSATRVLRLLGVNRQAQNAEQYYTPEELQLIVQESEELGAHPRGVRADAAGAVRVRRSDGRRGDGAARPDHRHPARQHARRGSASCSARSPHTRYPDLRRRPRSHRRHDPHQGSAAPAAARRDDRPGARAAAAARARRRRRSTLCWRRCGASARRWSS